MKIKGIILVMVILTLSGIALLSSCATVTGITPSTTSYPADVIARINPTSTLLMSMIEGEKQITITPKSNSILWVTNVVAKNKSYPKPILGTNSDWAIKSGNTTYGFPNAINAIPMDEPKMNTGIGQTGKMKLCFEVPTSLVVNDAQLVYKGQQPYSYGKLIQGDKVSAYDFDANKAITITKQTDVASVQRIWVSAIWIGGGSLYVELKPKSTAIANKVYVVELYEKGNLRATSKVSWNQPQINVSTMIAVVFPATRQECEAYGSEYDVNDIFSAKVHE